MHGLKNNSSAFSVAHGSFLTSRNEPASSCLPGKIHLGIAPSQGQLLAGQSPFPPFPAAHRLTALRRPPDGPSTIQPLGVRSKDLKRAAPFCAEAVSVPPGCPPVLSPLPGSAPTWPGRPRSPLCSPCLSSPPALLPQAGGSPRQPLFPFDVSPAPMASTPHPRGTPGLHLQPQPQP